MTRTHVYANYIRKEADRHRDWKHHESHCETLKPQGPKYGSDGQVYDVYVIRHCTCWLSLENLSLEREFYALHDLSYRYDLHSQACKRYLRKSITYRGKPDVLRFPCDCWLSVPFRDEEVDKPNSTPYTGPMPNENNPVVEAIKAQVEQIRQNALGPHLDTPIYDQLAREYDAKYGNLDYFESPLGQRIMVLSSHLRRHRA